jgi:hypothetical protein
MREKLNSNPLVQAALIGVLALAVGLMLLMRMGGSAEPAATEPVPADPAAAAAADPAAASPADPAAAAPAAAAPSAPVDPAAGVAPSADSVTPPPVSAIGDFKPGPGLPKDIVDAYETDKAVVLLIVQEDGIDDDEIKRSVESLRQRSDAAVFVTKASDVARYSRITQGVDLDRTPALVIIFPKQLSDGPMPTASVSYGFRGIASVDQALDDALYKGPDDLPYYPN